MGLLPCLLDGAPEGWRRVGSQAGERRALVDTDSRRKPLQVQKRSRVEERYRRRRVVGIGLPQQLLGLLVLAARNGVGRFGQRHERACEGG